MDSSKKIISPSKLKRFRAAATKSRKKIVFTNGCFDILHPGHVSYLEKAKSKGDLLIVAVDTDAAVRRLKGKDRPVNPLKSRMRVLAGLGCVDAVTWFGGGNPIGVIKQVRPNVLVKGGDWKVPQILGSKEVLSWKGKVYSLPFVRGKSTTRLIKKIQSL